MKKVNYTEVEELLGNDSFLAWHCQTNKTERNKWNEWIKASEENRRLANEAGRLLELIMMAKENSPITEQQINRTFGRITSTIAIIEKQKVKEIKSK